MLEPLPQIVYAESEIWTDTPYSFDNAVRKTDQPIWVLQRTLRGKAFMEYGGTIFEVTPGHCMIFQHGENSRYWAQSSKRHPYELSFICFEGPPVPFLFESLRNNLGTVFELPSGCLPEMEYCDLIEQFRLDKFANRFEQGAAVYRFILSLLQFHAEGGTIGKAEERAHSYIRDHFRTPITQESVARQVGVSREHLARQYRKRYGESPGTHCRRLRLEQAATLLRVSTTTSIQEIALSSGYTDANSFTRAFRNYYGCSPTSIIAKERSLWPEGH